MGKPNELFQKSRINLKPSQRGGFLTGENMLKTFRATTIILTLSIMTFIFYMSSQTADESSASSSLFIEFFAKIFVSDFEMLTFEKQASIVSSLQFIVRKGAHFSIYALLGGLSYLSVVTYNKISFKMRTVLSAVACLIYSVSDEIHQSFVPGRSGELRDVCIDFCGSLLAILILTFIFKHSKFKFIKYAKGEKYA